MNNHLDNVISTIKTDPVDNLANLSKNVHILWSDIVNFQPQAHEIGNYNWSNQIDELKRDFEILFFIKFDSDAFKYHAHHLFVTSFQRTIFGIGSKGSRYTSANKGAGDNGPFMAARGQKIRQSPYLHVHLYHPLRHLIAFYSKYVIINQIHRENQSNIAERRRI